jgi:hypothetical protein
MKTVMFLVRIMNKNSILKIIGLIGFGVGIFFALQVKQQLDIADEFMQLSAQCIVDTSCEHLKDQTDLRLDLWSGNLKRDLMFVFLSWIVWGGVLVVTNEKTVSSIET